MNRRAGTTGPERSAKSWRAAGATNIGAALAQHVRPMSAFTDPERERRMGNVTAGFTNMAALRTYHPDMEDDTAALKEFMKYDLQGGAGARDVALFENISKNRLYMARYLLLTYVGSAATPGRADLTLLTAVTPGDAKIKAAVARDVPLPKSNPMAQPSSKVLATPAKMVHVPPLNASHLREFSREYHPLLPGRPCAHGTMCVCKRFMCTSEGWPEGGLTTVELMLPDELVHYEQRREQHAAAAQLYKRATPGYCLWCQIYAANFYVTLFMGFNVPLEMTVQTFSVYADIPGGFRSENLLIPGVDTTGYLRAPFPKWTSLQMVARHVERGPDIAYWEIDFSKMLVPETAAAPPGFWTAATSPQ